MILLSVKYFYATSFCFLMYFFQDPSEHYHKGKSEFYAGHYATCITELKQCEQDTLFKDCDYLIAMSYLNLKEYTPAIPYFKKDISAHEKNYNAYMQLAACYRAGHRNRKSGAVYNHLLHLQPSYYPAYFEKGNMKFDAGKYKPAVKLYKKTLSYNPGFENAFYKLGYCFLDLKDTAAACGYWNKIQDLDDFKNYQEIERICLSKHSPPAKK